MHPKIKGARRALFSFLALVAVLGLACEYDHLPSNQPIIVADVEVTILQNGQKVDVYNGNQARVTVVGSVWQPELMKYVCKFHVSMSCYQSTTAKTDFDAGDAIEFLFIVNGDTIPYYTRFDG